MREARVRAADEEMVVLTQEFIAKQAAAAAHAAPDGRNAVAILREEQAGVGPPVEQAEDYSKWLEEQQALTSAMQSMYQADEGDEDEEDTLAYVPSAEDEDGGSQPASAPQAAVDARVVARAAEPVQAAATAELGEVVAVDEDTVLQLQRMEAAWRNEQQALTARRQALQALYQPGGEDISVMELQQMQQAKHAAKIESLQQQLAQAQMRQHIGGRPPRSAADTREEARFEEHMRLAMQLSLAEGDCGGGEGEADSSHHAAASSSHDFGKVCTASSSTASSSSSSSLTTLALAGPAADGSASARELVCRFCYSGASAASLFYPCSCTAPLHRECLVRWQRQQVGKAGEDRCEVCRSKWSAPLRMTAGKATLEQWIDNQSRQR